MTFNYLGVEVTSCRNIIEEIATQANKTAKVSGYLYGTIWRNKHMTMKSKMKIYKTVAKLIVT